VDSHQSQTNGVQWLKLSKDWSRSSQPWTHLISMYPRIRRYSAPRKLLPQVRRLLGLCSLEAWLQSPTRLQLICILSAVCSALRKEETKFWFKCFIPIFSAKTIQRNSLADMILPTADFSFAKRNVCFLYPRFFMSTYEQHRRLQPLAGL